MQKENPFYTPIKNIDPIHGSQGFDSGYAATLPFNKSFIASNTVVIDSRSRDPVAYPSPSNYKLNLGDSFKNITSLELKGAIIPRSSSNVHTSNNIIDFSIGSSITSIKIKEPGVNYTSAPSIFISAPDNPGIQATAVAFIDPSSKRVVSILITNPGSGYLRSKPPSIIIGGPSSYNKNNVTATAIAEVGTLYKAALRVGQYSIGGNTPSGLILEIQDAMNYAVTNTYIQNSTTPFQVRLVSQYPELNSTPGEPESFDTNATQYNRIQFTNILSEHWELLFGTGPNKFTSAQNLLGFPAIDQYEPVSTPTVSPVLTAGTSLRSIFDYDLLDDPKFVVLSFFAEAAFERITSLDSSLDRKFGVMVFDANSTDVIKDTTGSSIISDNVSYLTGPVQKGTFWTQPGTLKALKGSDFDQKKITFNPPIGKLTTIEVQFTCFGKMNGGTPILYDFQGRENLLVFEISATDQQSGIRS